MSTTTTTALNRWRSAVLPAIGEADKKLKSAIQCVRDALECVSRLERSAERHGQSLTDAIMSEAERDGIWDSADLPDGGQRLVVETVQEYAPPSSESLLGAIETVVEARRELAAYEKRMVTVSKVTLTVRLRTPELPPREIPE